MGDVHGRADLLSAHLGHIRATDPKPETPVVLLGDYVDRGPAAAQVIDLVLAAQHSARAKVIALRGNHEQLMLDFLSAETPDARWLQVGGAETLASYGVARPSG